MDWKDALGALRNEMPDPTPDDETQKEKPQVAEKTGRRQSRKLNVVMERKGRGGKTATIIDGFEIPDDELQEVARRLKQTLGIGGSARGGEILLQGDCREKVIPLLKSMGF